LGIRPAHAATVPVFDWVHAYNSTLIDPASAIIKQMALDQSDGSVYMGSRFNGTPDFDPSSGTSYATSTGGNDAFFSKFSTDGAYQYTRTWGGTGTDYTSALVTAADGSIYAGSKFQSTVDFDPGAATSYATSTGGSDNALLKFDSSGNFQWVKTWGGTGSDETIAHVEVDSNGNVYVSGYFSGSIDFDPTAAVATSTAAGAFDFYLSKFSSDGTYQWTKKWGGSSYDYGLSLAIDSVGNVYAGGLFGSTVDFDPGAATTSATSAGGFSDGFLSKFDSSGNFQWVKTWGGTGLENVQHIKISSDDGDVAVVVYFDSAIDLDPGADTLSASPVGGIDSALVVLTSDGALQWAKAWGGSGTDDPRGSIFDSDGGIYVGGFFNSTVDFDPSSGTNDKTSTGAADIYISRFSADGEYQFTRTFGGSGNEFWDNIQSYPTGDPERMIITGTYTSAPADFDPSPAAQSYSSDGTDTFLVSFDLIDVAVTVSSTGATITEGTSDEATYTLALRTPPDNDVTVLVTPGPQLYADVSSITFSSSTWNVPQTVTLTAIDDNSVEDAHTGTVTHTVSSTANEYDGLSVANATVSITDNDSRGSSGGGSGGDSEEPGSAPEVTPPQDTLASLFEPIPTPVDPLTPEEREEFVSKVMHRLISVLTHLIGLLRAQLAAAGQGME